MFFISVNYGSECVFFLFARCVKPNKQGVQQTQQQQKTTQEIKLHFPIILEIPTELVPLYIQFWYSFA